MLVAKRRSALRFLQAVISEHKIEKRYLALVAGKMGKSNIVLAPLKKNVLQSGERVVRVDAEGKSAESHFYPSRSCKSSTLVEVKIVTGRTHQIRVHATHIGHPLAGDERYGEHEYNRKLKQAGLNRLFLHASQLIFPHPANGTNMRLHAPLPIHLSDLLKRICPLSLQHPHQPNQR